MLAPEAVIERFVESVGRPDEARLYIEHWRSDTPERFALIDVAAIEGDGPAAALVADLHYLAAVRLYPVLVGATTPALERLASSAAPIAIVEDAAGAASAVQRGTIAVSRAHDIDSWLTTLGSRKLIILGNGGLHLANGEPISLVNTTTERETLEVELAPEQRRTFARACSILERHGPPLTIGLTSPFDLLRELFTVRGAGTLLRVGSLVTSLEEPTPFEYERLRALLTTAFGRPIGQSFFRRKRAATLIAGDYRGTAIVEDAEPAPYLSKFAVGPAARGEGVGRDLWHQLVARFPRIVWRARQGNPINNWYHQNSHGSFRAEPWTVFWRGLRASELEAAIEFALSRPDDFDPTDSGCRISSADADG